MDHRQDPDQESLDRARDLLRRTVEALSRTGQSGEPDDVEGLRELLEALRKVPAPANDETRAA